MSYTKEIQYRDYSIVFDYDLDKETTTLVLGSFDVFEGTDEVGVLSSLEIQFIEREIYKWLDEEIKLNGENYVQDYLDSLQEKRYSRNIED